MRSSTVTVGRLSDSRALAGRLSAGGWGEGFRGEAMKRLLLASIPDFVRINGVVYPGLEKGPFVASGKGVLGAIAYSPKEDLVQCHECGAWFESVAAHLRLGHSMSGAEYKRKHGLRQRTGLINERLKQLHRAHNADGRSRLITNYEGTRRRSHVSSQADHMYETRNETGRCTAQLIATLRRIKEELGRTPTTGELAARGLHHATLMHGFNVKSLAEVFRMTSLAYPNGSTSNGSGSPGKEYCIESLRDFHSARKRLPLQHECGTGGLPTYKTFLLRFGSIWKAFEEAGLGAVALARANTLRGYAKQRAFQGLRGSVGQEESA